jgi:predicted CopG family antitoxin
MATKTITIDLEAYDLLKSSQSPNESFSKTIKRVIAPRMDVDNYLYRIRATPLSGKAATAIREHVEARHRPVRRTR